MYNSKICAEKMMAEQSYLQATENTVKKVYAIQKILASATPYWQISELPGLMQELSGNDILHII